MALMEPTVLWKCRDRYGSEFHRSISHEHFQATAGYFSISSVLKRSQTKEDFQSLGLRKKQQTPIGSHLGRLGRSHQASDAAEGDAQIRCNHFLKISTLPLLPA